MLKVICYKCGEEVPLQAARYIEFEGKEKFKFCHICWQMIFEFISKLKGGG